MFKVLITGLEGHEGMGATFKTIVKISFISGGLQILLAIDVFQDKSEIPQGST